MELKNKILKKRKKVAKIIVSKRERLNMTQQDLADLSGCSRSTIARIEGEVYSPNADQLYTILETLSIKMRIDDILIS